MLRNYLQPQFIVYVIIGLITNLLDLFLYWLMVDNLEVWYLAAAAVVTPVVLGFNYLAHRQFTFHSRGMKRKQLPRYLALTVFNYLLGLALLYIFVDVLSLHYLVGKVMVLAVIVMYNFLALKVIVFQG